MNLCRAAAGRAADTRPIGDTVKDYAVTSWLGVAGPAGLPAPFVARLNAELKAMLAEPAVIERLRDIGSETRPTAPEGFRARVADDVAKWTRVVAEAKIPKVG
jgi:tripartite-type tricarboxylate transporter receptor subunit TctC